MHAHITIHTRESPTSECSGGCGDLSGGGCSYSGLQTSLGHAGRNSSVTGRCQSKYSNSHSHKHTVSKHRYGHSRKQQYTHRAACYTRHRHDAHERQYCPQRCSQTSGNRRQFTHVWVSTGNTVHQHFFNVTMSDGVSYTQQ